MQEISSNYMLNRIRHEIRKSEDDMRDLKGIYNCGRRVSRFSSGVHVVSNGKDTKFVGVAFCHSGWSCPVCAARKMADYCRRINAVIDALKERSIPLVPLLVTFTIPHTRHMPLSMLLNVLYDTWKAFRKRARSTKRKCTSHHNDVMYRFTEFAETNYMVRATEVTHGKHGWHPHFHVLMWIRADKTDSAELFVYESELRQRWQELVEHYIAKYYEPRKPDPDGSRSRYFAARLCKYANWDEHPGVFISRDNTGKVIIADSGSYICGWSAGTELTALAIKKARGAGSRTVAELLHAAVYDNDQRAMDLYMDYMRATRKTRRARVFFSFGLNDIAKAQLNKEVYRKALVKKFADRERWRSICWFSKALWFEICSFDSWCPILTLIAYWATKADGLQRINGLLNAIGLPNAEAAGVDTEAVLKLLNEPPPPYKIPDAATA